MKTIHKTYRFALSPTKEQEVLLNKHLGCVRFVFNYFLNQRINQYRESKKSDNYRDRQRLKVALIHEKVAKTRLDLLHKVSAQITKEYDTICLEDLNVKGMVANRRLARHIGDAGWGIFIRLLEYKANWNNKQVVKVNRFYPSSKTCSECGYIHQNLTLSERTWTCLNGHVLDRAA